MNEPFTQHLPKGAKALPLTAFEVAMFKPRYHRYRVNLPIFTSAVFWVPFLILGVVIMVRFL